MHAAARHRWLALVLVALVCAQALGFMHRVAHAPAAFGAVLHTAPGTSSGRHVSHESHLARAAHGGADQHARHTRQNDPQAHAGEPRHLGAPNWLALLFSLHEGEGDCRLYDSAGPQVLACAVPLVVPILSAPLAYLRLLAFGFVARWAALFDARGPPSFSR
ncbi:hypothetical protein WG922_06955 [Ramlibacter sp. AN1015]|uniref:hypothetical protein n=1 Tax=Ramlibacter sp. AN1015 TaxID=3133428 RepID=UPI0030BA7770